MAWTNRNNKLARFFAFKYRETRDTFFDRLKKLDTKSNYAAHAIKIGEKAIVVKCGNGETISNKDRFMTAAIDSLARSIAGSTGSNSSRSSTKLAEEKRAFIGGLASKMFNGAGRAMPNFFNAASKTWGLKRIPGFAERMQSPMRQTAANATFKQNPNLLGDLGKMTGAPGKPLTSGQVTDQLATNMRATGAPGVDEAAGALAGQGQNRFFRLGLKGRGDLQNLMTQLESAGHGKTEAYKALQSQYNAMGRNRYIAGAGAIGAGATADAYMNRKQPAKGGFFGTVANIPATGAELAGAPGLGKMMRDNPEVTTLGSGAALAAILYSMWSASNNRYR
jgi:hypothetical protein